MSEAILAKDIEKHCGKYVATKSFRSKKVICSGSDPLKVFEKAKKMGADDPVIFYVPEKDTVHIYICL